MRKIFASLIAICLLAGIASLSSGCANQRSPGHQQGHPGSPPEHAPAHGQREQGEQAPAQRQGR